MTGIFDDREFWDALTNERIANGFDTIILIEEDSRVAPSSDGSLLIGQLEEYPDRLWIKRIPRTGQTDQLYTQYLRVEAKILFPHANLPKGIR